MKEKRRPPQIAAAVLWVFLAAACSGGGTGGNGTPTPRKKATDRGKENGTVSITLSSSAFQDGAAVPRKYTGEGPDVSPPLQWSGVPPGTASLALICDDPDAPTARPWVHWVLYNLPATAGELTEGVPTKPVLPDGSLQGRNDFGKSGYGGPLPPPGKPHRYFFRLYALDVKLSLPAGATKAEVEAAMKGHVLAEGVLKGTYQR